MCMPESYPNKLVEMLDSTTGNDGICLRSLLSMQDLCIR